MRLHNTLSGKMEPFVPLDPPRVGIYVCGPTVYDYAHVGHARSAVFFDVLVRYFKGRGYVPIHVRNFTDIDDKIIERARTQQRSATDLAHEYIFSYREDMKLLGVMPPDFEPKVSDSILSILSMIGALIEKGCAYCLEGDVWYRVRSQPDYGLLHPTRQGENATAGYRISLCNGKEDSRDFVIWKKTADDAPAWESPWGRGRPGWHIQCVAMSQGLLGPRFDIHGGGRDLIFPHHENERALSRSLTGLDPARYWVHHELVTVQGEKLSKSSGAPVRIRDLSLRLPPEAIRLFLLSTHYRRPIDINEERLSGAVSALDRLYGFFRRVEGHLDWDHSESLPIDSDASPFAQEMDHDFNVPGGIAYLFSSLRKFNRLMDQRGGYRELPEIAQKEIQQVFSICRGILGILRDSPGAYFRKRMNDLRLNHSPGLSLQY